MVAALFSTTLVDTVSLGFESFLLTAEKMKTTIFRYYENKPKKNPLSYEKDLHIAEMQSR